MISRRAAFACLILLFGMPAGSGLAQPAVPEALEPWREWVLFGQEHRACPVLNGRGTAAEDNFICAWPGELEIAVELDGASFEQAWTLYKDEWVPLPGDASHWPSGVEVDGMPEAAVLRAGRPTVRVPAGEHRLGGRLDWETRPASLPVPTQTGLVALTLDGAQVAYPELEQGVLWLGLRAELAVEEDRLNVEVYRLLGDDIPIRLTTRIELDVAGQGRELELTGALPPGFVGESLSSGLPAELDADGTLRVQLRPGRWVTTLAAHHPDIVTELERPAAVPPWPEQEVWSFRTNPSLRVAVLEGAPAVDSQRAGVPPEWRGLPSFAVDAGQTLDLIERSRNDASADNELSLTRFLWLDFDGRGFTAEDRVSGRLRSGWRLDMAPPYTMTMAATGGENLLVTEGPEPGTQGVELRTQDLQLSATARLPAQFSLPVTGYTDSFDLAATVLHLPPAYRLIAAPGADTVDGAWIERWRLLEIFLALIIAVAAWRLLGRAAGLVALATVVLIFHEPWAPQYAWLNLLLVTALLRVVPEGRLRAWCRRYRQASLAALGLLLIPFAALELRAVVFPQLEQPFLQRSVDPGFNLGASIANLRGLDTFFGTRTLTLVDSRRNAGAVDLNFIPSALVGRMETVTGNRAATFGADAMAGVVNVIDPAGQEPATVAGAAPGAGGGAGFAIGQGQVGRYQPGALVQTGPGLPDWAWTSYALGFAGPIDAEQTFSLVIFGPWLVGLWRVAGVALALAFAWLLLKPELGRPRGGTARGTARGRGDGRGGGSASVGAAAVAVALMVSPFVADAQTAEGFPSAQILDELRTRLLREAPCQPSCAELTRAAVAIDDAALAVDLELALQDAVAVPVPGDTRGWRPDRVMVDGAEQRRLYRDGSGQTWLRLDAGVRDVRLEGPIPETDSLTLPFPLNPRRIAVDAPGWDVAGVSEGRLPSGALELIRQRQDEDAADAIQPTAFPPYVRVTRDIGLGLDWIVTTTVQRIAPAAGAFTLGVALLPEEAVVTSEVEVENGVATAAFAAGQNTVFWQSRIPTAAALSLTAGNDVPWSELWRFTVGHEWHADYDGPPAFRHLSVGNALATDFLPRPGETLVVALSRPDPATGDTIAIDNVDYAVNVGERASTSSLQFTYRSTRSEEHVLRLPEGSELQSVTIDGQAVPLQLDGNELTLPVTPGEHGVALAWRNRGGVGLRSAAPAVDLGAGASNITTTLNLPGDRWALATSGPTLGPAVLYWAELAVFVLAAVILGRIPLSPLRTHEWLLLGLGLSTFSWPVLLLFAAWAFLLSLRGQKTIDGPRSVFNAVQAALALLTIATVAVLIVSVGNGLLGSPNMHVVSPVPGGAFSWFVDRTVGATPSAGIVSVSLWFYKAAMLAWALWLSFALLKWLRWAFAAWSVEGLWRGKVAQASS
jgi:hypothetical protein